MSGSSPKNSSQLIRLPVDQDPDWELIPTPSDQIHPNSTENSLLTSTLRTERAVREIRTYVRHPQHQQQADSVEEICTFFSLGDGLNGIKDTCHGGIISMMLDETTGQLAAKVFGRYNIITAGLNVSFKRRVETPTVVMCRAWYKPDDTSKGGDPGKGGRRKLVVKGVLENEAGLVLATGEGVFVRFDHKL